MLTISHEQLKAIVKESVKEALEEELIKMRLMFFPETSDKEMLDISNRYGKPEETSVYKETLYV
ncbi:hypothetical protein [Candidatus Magnetomonas plexicatena]|uniref:hypothetical protein n=1 Tax=Candidatus Magnetomonas plexicatena TaxID=2552947 RepID=UPI001C74EC7B|nr:hypothetical protein E2O03_006370 [Nitrospirales bacterium LBB_01]